MNEQGLNSLKRRVWLLIGISVILLCLFNDEGNLKTVVEKKFGGTNLKRMLSGTSSEGASQTDSTQSLFGSLAHINYKDGTASLLIIIFAVLSLEQLFQLLHYFTRETAFNAMVSKMEKELMIVGCTAFIFKIVVNTNTTFLKGDWFHALEFADFLIPLFSFFYCSIAFLLIVLSLYLCDLRSKAHNFDLFELLEKYYGHAATMTFKYLQWKPVSHVIQQLEFRIFHNIFCDLYKTKRTAIAFDEYAQKIFEKFVESIVEIRPVDWLQIAVFLILNLIRNSLDWNLKQCEEHDYACINETSLVIYVGFGFVLYLLTCLFVVYSRYLELQIIRSRGIDSFEHYAVYLQHHEIQNGKNVESERMDENKLKDVILLAKKKQDFQYEFLSEINGKIKHLFFQNKKKNIANKHEHDELVQKILFKHESKKKPSSTTSTKNNATKKTSFLLPKSSKIFPSFLTGITNSKNIIDTNSSNNNNSNDAIINNNNSSNNNSSKKNKKIENNDNHHGNSVESMKSLASSETKKNENKTENEKNKEQQQKQKQQEEDEEVELKMKQEALQNKTKNIVTLALKNALQTQRLKHKKNLSNNQLFSRHNTFQPSSFLTLKKETAAVSKTKLNNDNNNENNNKNEKNNENKKNTEFDIEHNDEIKKSAKSLKSIVLSTHFKTLAANSREEIDAVLEQENLKSNSNENFENNLIDDSSVHFEKENEITKLFFLSRPYIYFEIVKTLILLIAFYCALWVCNFCTVSKGSGVKVYCVNLNIYCIYTITFINIYVFLFLCLYILCVCIFLLF